uniref:Ovule protein n=1 Tax=Schistocephalus solidus TaxID=70667 RepID=A0A183SCB3_SCHSO
LERLNNAFCKKRRKKREVAATARRQTTACPQNHLSQSLLQQSNLGGFVFSAEAEALSLPAKRFKFDMNSSYQRQQPPPHLTLQSW